MNSFRLGLWVGFVASIVFAALWDSEPEQDDEMIEDQGLKIKEASPPTDLNH